MTERPLEVTEMAIRTLLLAIWFASLASGLLWWSWPLVSWGLEGFPGGGAPDGWRLFAYCFAAFMGVLWTLRAAGMLAFQLLPFVIARLLQRGPPKLQRRG